MHSPGKRLVFYGCWFLLACAACGAGAGASASMDAHRTDGMHLQVFGRSLTTECGGKVEPDREDEIPGVTPKWLLEEPTAEENAKLVPPRPCGTDEECCPGFCDRGVCMAVVRSKVYGGGCYFMLVAPEPPPSIAQLPGPVGGIIDPCGAYVCHQGRCRSCQSDADCGKDARCRLVDGLPGKRCGSK